MSRTGQSTIRTCAVLSALKKASTPISIQDINDALLQAYGIDVCYSTTWHDVKHMCNSGIVTKRRVSEMSRDWLFSLSEDWK